MPGVTSWNSELPSGRNPFWIKDEGLAELGLHPGDAVSVDTAREPVDGDLVLAEVESETFSGRLVRRYFASDPDGAVRLVPANPQLPTLVVEREQVLVLGVVYGRLTFEPAGDDAVRVIETPL